MTEYIDRGAAKETHCNICKECHICYRGRDCVERKAFDKIPTADVRPVVRGEWVETIEQNGWEDVRCASCSACGDSYVLDEWGIDDLKGLFNFCPNCGAYMRKAVEE